MHTKAMWPIHGKYICLRCQREYVVDWEGPAAPEYGDPRDPRDELAARVWLPD
jgi:hypothetical protein